MKNPIAQTPAQIIAERTSLVAQITTLENQVASSNPDFLTAVGRLPKDGKGVPTSTLVKRKAALAAVAGKPLAKPVATTAKPKIEAEELGRAFEALAKDPVAGAEFLSAVEKATQKLSGRELTAAAFNKQLPHGKPMRRETLAVPSSSIVGRGSKVSANNAKYKKAIDAVDAQIKAAAKIGKISQELLSRRRELETEWQSSNAKLSSTK